MVLQLNRLVSGWVLRKWRLLQPFGLVFLCYVILYRAHVLMPAWNCSTVLGGQLHANSRRHWLSTSVVCQSAEVCTALSNEQFWSSALCFCGPVDLEFAAWQSSWLRTESWHFQTSAEDVLFSKILTTKCIQRITYFLEYVLWKFTLCLLTCLLTYLLCLAFALHAYVCFCVLLGTVEEAGCSRTGRRELQEEDRGAVITVPWPGIPRSLWLGQHPWDSGWSRVQVPRLAGAGSGQAQETRRDQEAVWVPPWGWRHWGLDHRQECRCWIRGLWHWYRTCPGRIWVLYSYSFFCLMPGLCHVLLPVAYNLAVS